MLQIRAEFGDWTVPFMDLSQIDAENSSECGPDIRGLIFTTDFAPLLVRTAHKALSLRFSSIFA